MDSILTPGQSVSQNHSDTPSLSLRHEDLRPSIQIDGDMDSLSPLSPDSLSSVPVEGPKKRQLDDRFKRRRSTRACSCCRARKVRCNVAECGIPCYNCQRDEVTCSVPERRSRRTKMQTKRKKSCVNGNFGEDIASDPLIPSKITTMLDCDHCEQNREAENPCPRETSPQSWDTSIYEEELANGLKLGFKLMALFLDQFFASGIRITKEHLRQSRLRDSCPCSASTDREASKNSTLQHEGIQDMDLHTAYQDLAFSFTKNVNNLQETRELETTIKDKSSNNFESQLFHPHFHDQEDDEALTISTPSDTEMQQPQPFDFSQPSDRCCKYDVLAQGQMEQFLIGSKELDTAASVYDEQNYVIGKDGDPMIMEEGFEEHVEALFDDTMEYQNWKDIVHLPHRKSSH
ncbi:hypothetical protein B7463_g5087, partial [Scytalidium lignicola]